MSADPPDYDPELDEELDRLAAKFPKRSGRREIPEDIRALRGAIREQALLCRVEPDVKPYQFDRFEAFDGKFGGMGMVIEARDPQLDRKVAIKVWMAAGQEAETALLAEAKALAKLAHPNVVTVHDTGKWQGRVYFVMEWVDGRDGHDWMTERAWSWREIRDVFVGAGRGLAAAHDAGIQHRDFKPSNMLVGHDGRVLVADFGVADVVHAAAGGESSEGSLVGTPTYMAPERLRGARGDARSDQFSFCVALWKALHGVRPYAGKTREDLLEYIDSGLIRRSRGAEIPTWLERVVLKGLDPDPDGRFSSMNELVDALLDEPPDAKHAGEDPGDESPTDDEKLLHAPAHEGRASSRQGYFLYGLMIGAVTAAVIVIGINSFAPSTTEPGPDSAAEIPPGEPADGTPALSTEDLEAITTPEKVIAKINEGQFEEASQEWLNETNRRKAVKVPTYPDSFRVGEAYLTQARILADADKRDEALEVASLADLWAREAQRDLERYNEPSREYDLLERTREFVWALDAASHNK